jgi:hypothetical protein
MGQVKAVMAFRTYEEFWEFCKRECLDRGVGCANRCMLRKLLGIPPFGKTYEGKLHGPVKVVG